MARRAAAISGLAAVIAMALAAASSAGRPHGVVLGCEQQSGSGVAGLGMFGRRSSLVIGPLAMSGAGARNAGYSEVAGGNKFPTGVLGGHRVTLEVAGAAASAAGLGFAGLPGRRRGYRAVTLVSCSQLRVSFWAGGVLADAPMCVPLRVWVDDERSPRRAVIHLGVRDCS